MKQKDIATIENELGKLEFEMPAKRYLLQTIFEQSSTNLDYEIPNPERELSILARPNGFHITSHDGRYVRKDFALAFNDITKVQLLPSYSTHIKKGISFSYVILYAIFAFCLGALFGQEGLLLLYVLLGAIFGGIFSLANNKEYRRNLMITYKEANTENYLRLSVAKSDWTEAVDYFSEFCPDKFVQ